MQKTSRRWALGALAGACAVLGGVATAGAQTGGGLEGYTPAHAVREQAYEQRFQHAVDPASIAANSRSLGAFNRLDGSAGDRRGFEQSVATLRSYGLDVHGASYGVYLSKPRNIQVTMTAPYRRPLATIEHNDFPWQTDTENVVPGYNAYSPSGDVEAAVVYANYGRPEDFKALDDLGIDVRGKIVLVRYGKNFRGVKAHLAEQRGAAGVVIYSDPQDDGFVKGPVYPNGPFRPADGIQRGSIQYLFYYPGDPLTPGQPSVPGTQRLDASQATNLPHIPSTPISYSEAKPLLRALGGPLAPEDFQGGLDFPYHVGPGPTAVHMNLDIDYGQAPINNAIAVIRGTKHPDQLVIVGGHQDAWTYGANDDLSGWTSVMEIGRRLGGLVGKGWRPDRTIVLAGWDGEEYGLLGSTEWTEQYERYLHGHAVAYLNVDITAGKTFGAGAVPALDGLLFDVTKTVAEPNAATSVFDAWKGDAASPTVDRLGSGSDYTAPLDHVGVPALEIGYTSPSGEYHSSYDDTYQLEHFLDPGYVHHAASAKILGAAALRLANADILPLRYSTYAQAVLGYIDDLQKVEQQPGAAQVDLAPLRAAATAWDTATRTLEARAAALLTQPGHDGKRKRTQQRINAALLRQERFLITPAGLPGRPWFRHQIYAPGINSGYATQELPGMRDAVEQGDTATATRYRDLLVASLQAAATDAGAAAGVSG
jgi:N-acetylated-alpha-linked acidic dipeptidase